MSQHMVIFQTADGSPAYSQFESVSEAVGFVESLRNDQGIENARMFELKEIKFELKPIFKVELLELNSGPAVAPKPAAPSAAPSAPSAPSAPASSATPAPAAPSAPPASSPTSGETTTFGTPTPPAGGSTAPAAPSAPPAAEPAAPADAPADGQPARRGLFGR